TGHGGDANGDRRRQLPVLTTDQRLWSGEPREPAGQRGRCVVGGRDQQRTTSEQRVAFDADPYHVTLPGTVRDVVGLHEAQSGAAERGCSRGNICALAGVADELNDN